MKRKMYLSVVVREHNGLWHETRRILVPSPMSAIEGMEISREVIVGIISAFSEDHEKNAGGEKKRCG